MKKFLIVPVMIALSGCATVGDDSLSVPDGEPLAGAQIRSLVEGGPYKVRIYDGDFAGTVGESVWDFSDNTVSGSFETADGETGTYSLPISVEGNLLCSGEAQSRECYRIYPYADGFMEVTTDGGVHAVSTLL